MSTMRERVRLITDPAYTPPGPSVPTRTRLGVALRAASIAARDFAMSNEPLHRAQREQYATLAETLEAQARSLRAEV